MQSNIESNACEDMSVSSALKVLELSEYEVSCLSIDVVVRQYRRMALKYHPDKNDNSEASHVAFCQLTTAYDIVRTMVSLSEEESSSLYTVLEQAKKELKNNNLEELRDITTSLEDSFSAFAEKRMNSALTSSVVGLPVSQFE